MIIIIDGPEKAGKTTTIEELVRRFTMVGIDSERVHWGPVSPDDRAYTSLLKQHVADTQKVWVWDRGWPSEFVYGRLLNRDRRMTLDPWIGEWLHGRAVQASGLRVILTGPPADVLSELRNASDLNVWPAAEQHNYEVYGRRFGWEVIQNEHTEESLHNTVEKIFERFTQINKFEARYTPPKWAGSSLAKIVVIEDELSSDVIPGGWLPFTGNFATLLGREFGDFAFEVAWTNAKDCDPRNLLNRETVITCGEFVLNWYYKNMDGIRLTAHEKKPLRHVSIPHPLYMFKSKSEKSDKQLETVRQVIQSLKPL